MIYVDQPEPLVEKTFFTAYQIKTDDPRDPLRVKGLQLLCFKLAQHKIKILKLLERFMDAPTVTSKDKRIPLSKLQDVFKDLSQAISIVFISYSQYIAGEIPTENNYVCIEAFEKYIYEKMIF